MREQAEYLLHLRLFKQGCIEPLYVKMKEVGKFGGVRDSLVKQISS